MRDSLDELADRVRAEAIARLAKRCEQIARGRWSVKATGGGIELGGEAAVAEYGDGRRKSEPWVMTIAQ